MATQITLEMNSVSGFRSRWHISARQLSCNEFQYEVLPQTGDGGPSIGISIETTTSIIPIISTVPSANYSRCGIKGASNIPTVGITEDESTIVGGDFDFADSVVPQIRWAVPEKFDSAFYRYSGLETDVLLGQRITYGEVAGVNEYPWQVAMFRGFNFHCGGSIISSTHILTAAHCVYNSLQNLDEIKIAVKLWDVSKFGPSKPNTHGLEWAKVHPDYSRFTLQNDIAILKLKKLILFNSEARPICLPDADIEEEGKVAHVTGWGKDEKGNLVTKLHKLQAAILSYNDCNQRWRSIGIDRGLITPAMICMDAQNGDSCNGDSGGPSVIQNPNSEDQFIQVGIVSFGSGSCTNKNLPGVYTKVANFVKWIRLQMKA